MRYATSQKILRFGIGLAQEIFSRPEKNMLRPASEKNICQGITSSRHVFIAPRTNDLRYIDCVQMVPLKLRSVFRLLKK